MPSGKRYTALMVLVLVCIVSDTRAFLINERKQNFWIFQADPKSNEPISAKEEAERLLARARKLRSEIPDQLEGTKQVTTVVSKWAVAPSQEVGAEYRLYVDIGREPGTWMDPRWGASGRRIEFTIDVRFIAVEADQTIQNNMVKDNLGGKSSAVYMLQSAGLARLRQGFDSFGVSGGGFRVDSEPNKNTHTARFYLQTKGTPEKSTYGDIFIPEGCLFFSIPCFGGRVSKLSRKEGPVTVRQVGWNTGWRREESRIVGTFRAVPIDEARKKDGF